MLIFLFSYFLSFNRVRRAVVEWVDIIKKPESPNRDRDLMNKILQISRFLPDPMKVQEFLQKFSVHMKKEPALLQGMETIVQPNVTCKECAETTSFVLKKLGQPVMTNLYYNTIKMLLERVSSVMIDEEAIRVSCYIQILNNFNKSKPCVTLFFLSFFF